MLSCFHAALHAERKRDLYSGPDTFERAKAAQQLAWLVRRLRAEALYAALGPALPCVQAAATDPSPAVQAQGMWALHHISQGLSNRALRHGVQCWLQQLL